MNSAWPLVSAALLMGAGGSLHCLTMCAGLQRMTLRGIPVITVKGDAATPRTSEGTLPPSAADSAPGRLKTTAASTVTPDNATLTGSSLARHLALKLPDARWWRFQAGRVLGYSLLGLAAGTIGQQVLAAAYWQPIFESVWAGLNALLVLLGLSLLVLGREPLWLGALGSRLASRTPLAPGRRTEWLRGMLWALLPCGLLYTALGTAILAATPLGAAAVMAAFALGTNLGLFLMEAGARNLLGNRAPQVAYRLNGILLIMLSAAGLAAALSGHAHPYC
ncbi:MAG: sulfite exporter TauE/SafE family protein [Lautropia mirabilis]